MQFHILSFEGPDSYARVGGLASRVEGLAEALSALELETHLWFVGDPGLPGHERASNGHRHRWCQWVSRVHAGTLYDHEHAKAAEYCTSLPSYLANRHLIPALLGGERAVVLAEEWHTVDAVLALDRLLRRARLRDRVEILWNANNTYGFERIDWPRLAHAARITTVSRYMRHQMQRWGVDALAIPNGLAPDAYLAPDRRAARRLQSAFADRLAIVKMARWDPDKRWLDSIRLIADLKRRGWSPLLIARGGTEPHVAEVLAEIRAAGLSMVERSLPPQAGPEDLAEALLGSPRVDVIRLCSHVDPASRRTLFRAADLVLANSAHEPFGLVGLEAMAAGGVAVTGCTGEDYAIAGRNALMLQSGDPGEFVGLYAPLRKDVAQSKALRLAGRRTAADFAWPVVLRTNLFPRLSCADEIQDFRAASAPLARATPDDPVTLSSGFSGVAARGGLAQAELGSLRAVAARMAAARAMDEAAPCEQPS